MFILFKLHVFDMNTVSMLGARKNSYEKIRYDKTIHK